MTDTVTVALITAVPAILAIIAGGYATYLTRQNKASEATKVRAEAEEIFERVRVMQLERERELIARLSMLEKDRRDLVGRLEAVEMQLHMAKKKYEDDLAAERARYETAVRAAKKLQESLEQELSKLREIVDHLTKENMALHARMKQLASRVETGELKERDKEKDNGS